VYSPNQKISRNQKTYISLQKIHSNHAYGGKEVFSLDKAIEYRHTRCHRRYI